MGFWSKVGNFITDTILAVDEFIDDVIDAGVDLCKNIYNSFTGTKEKWVEPDPEPIWDPDPTDEPEPPTSDDDSYDYDPEPEYIDWAARNIEEGQTRILPQAKKFENLVKEDFIRSYDPILAELKKIIDTKPIEKFIKNKSSEFDYQMRNELNDKISQANDEFMDIIYDSAKARKYVDDAYYEAKNGLLDTLDDVMNQTNEFIKVHTEKYLSDEQDALKVLREDLTSKLEEGDKKEKLLKKTAVEYTGLLFIKEIANQNFANKG